MDRLRPGIFGPRTSRYPMLRGYLASRPKPPLVKVPNREGLLAMAIMGSSLTVAGSLAHQWVLLPIGVVIAGMSGVAAFRERRPLPPTPEQELAAKADAVLKEIHPYVEWNRLHRAFHPAVAATLEECAGYHARIETALGERDWRGHADLRENALVAAKVAMDEAIVHAGATLAYVPPTRPLDGLSDTLEEIGLGSIRLGGPSDDPIPPAFRPIRDLAERLRELAVRCETAAIHRRGESPDPVSPAFRHLDATLGEMRGLEEAEGELRQGA